jgi:hypothetical protein
MPVATVATVFTRMCCFAYSIARLRVTASRPPLAIIGTAEFIPAIGWPTHRRSDIVRDRPVSERNDSRRYGFRVEADAYGRVASAIHQQLRFLLMAMTHLTIVGILRDANKGQVMAHSILRCWVVVLACTAVPCGRTVAYAEPLFLIVTAPLSIHHLTETVRSLRIRLRRS